MEDYCTVIVMDDLQGTRRPTLVGSTCCLQAGDFAMIETAGGGEYIGVAVSAPVFGYYHGFANLFGALFFDDCPKPLHKVRCKLMEREAMHFSWIPEEYRKEGAKNE